MADYVYDSQASHQACSLLTDLVRDKNISAMSLSERIALMQACALVAISHEIGELVKATVQVSHQVSKQAAATDILATSMGKLTEETIHISTVELSVRAWESPTRHQPELPNSS